MRPVFLFVDLLEDFFRQPPLSEKRQSLVEAANDLVSIAEAASAPIIWVRQEFRDDLSDAFLSMRDTGRRVTIAGTEGCRVLRELHVKEQQKVIVKKRYSAFHGTELEDTLRSLGGTHLVISGVNTHACVRATAVDAYQRDFYCLFAEEAIASYDDEFHRESMRYLVQSIGKGVTNLELRKLLIDSQATA